MQQTPYDSSDPAQVKRAKVTAKILTNRMRNGMLKIISDPESRFVLASFLDHAKVFVDTFNTQPTQHAFNDGFRNAGLWWLREALLHDPGFIAKLMADEDNPLRIENDGGRNPSGNPSDPGPSSDA